MNEPVVTKQAILGQECYEQVIEDREDAVKKKKKKEEKAGNSHTWKHFPGLRGFKRQTMESNNTLKQLRAAQSGSH